MVTKELIKAEIDNVQEKYLERLYRIVKAFEHTSIKELVTRTDKANWQQFITETYGSFADDPIEIDKPGEFEIREEIL